MKQSVGQLGTANSFWYCYQANNGGWQYLGVEAKLDAAKARCISGKMRVPAEELESWLRANADTIPPDLHEAETARLAEWKKNPESKRLREPVTGGVVVKAVPGEGKRAAKEERTAPREKTSPSPKLGRPSQDSLIVIVKRAPTGKPGTKWRQRQEHVFAMAGKSVADVKDNDAVNHMIKDGTIKLAGAGE